MFEDFENGVGTYLKVVRFPEPSNPDGFVVLYLRSTGSFLVFGILAWLRAIRGSWHMVQAR